MATNTISNDTAGRLTFDLADRMTKALRVSNVKVGEMADYLGVSRATVANWTSGRIQPSTQSKRLWAMRTGVPFEWLETGKAPENPGPEGSNMRTSDYKRARSARIRHHLAGTRPSLRLLTAC